MPAVPGNVLVENVLLVHRDGQQSLFSIYDLPRRTGLTTVLNARIHQPVSKLPWNVGFWIWQAKKQLGVKVLYNLDDFTSLGISDTSVDVEVIVQALLTIINRLSVDGFNFDVSDQLHSRQSVISLSALAREFPLGHTSSCVPCMASSLYAS